MECPFPISGRRATFCVSTALVTFLVVAGFALPTPATADPVTIQSGYLNADTGDPPGLVLLGDGLRIGAVFFGGARFGPINTCFRCSPGDPIDFTASLVGTGFHGGWEDLIFNGVPVTPNPDFNRGVLVTTDLRFTAPTVPAPPIDASLTDRTSVSVPFTLEGSLIAHAWGGTVAEQEMGPELFRTELTGGGMATLLLSPSCASGAPGDCSPTAPYQFLAITYAFAPTPAPVPEPATLVLIGSGLSLLAAARVRRRR